MLKNSIEHAETLFIVLFITSLGQQNLDTTRAYTQFYRIKGGSGMPPSPTFYRVDEIQKFCMNSALCHARSRSHKICKLHQLFQKLLVMRIIIDRLYCKIMTAVSATRRETNIFEASHFLIIFQIFQLKNAMYKRCFVYNSKVSIALNDVYLLS